MQITTIEVTFDDGSKQTIFPVQTPSTPKVDVTIEVDPSTTSATVTNVSNK